MDTATPDSQDIADHLNTYEDCEQCAERAWCDWCEADTIPIRDMCHECNQPVSRTFRADRIEET